ncbi:ABC transporter substrate-binding protein [Acidimicrobiia bacterium]|nr:ABC transporter substrate-binding protein [Acidimicrobiia bacterium]MDA8710176.1 ABC transporter substrate-binding protein [Candidatus Actinomarina sp.]MDA8719269.1 ABC transporter substrate-binding protein [Candidatus Actinomarina sp.]MDA9179184.1 ABC transporter substrate-binding protein [Acidimicrobiia bacterium]MDA9198021.1 ABC transporter substrate-binding protein [Acidimicrobiia bacterium]
MRNKKTLILIFALALVATACSGTATPCDEVDITTGDNGLPDLGGCEFTFAVENAYLPFNYIDAETGEAMGWDYDVFNHMGELMNFTPVYVPTAWDGMIQATADGQFMIAGDGITITAERDEIVDFSNGYINLAQKVLVAADNAMVMSIDDLKSGDYTVAVQKGTTNYEFAVAQLGEDKVKAFDTFDFAIAAVISGDADASIIDETAGLGYMGANKDKVKLVGGDLTSEQLGFAFPNGSPLVDVVNQGLAAMTDSGKLGEINAKFFSPDFVVTYDDIAECDENIPAEYLPEDCEV